MRIRRRQAGEGAVILGRDTNAYGMCSGEMMGESGRERAGGKGKERRMLGCLYRNRGDTGRRTGFFAQVVLRERERGHITISIPRVDRDFVCRSPPPAVCTYLRTVINACGEGRKHGPRPTRGGYGKGLAVLPPKRKWAMQDAELHPKEIVSCHKRSVKRSVPLHCPIWTHWPLPYRVLPIPDATQCWHWPILTDRNSAPA